MILVIAAGVAIWWAFTHTDRLVGVLKTATAIVAPFLLGFCIAFVLNVLLRPLEKGWTRLFGRCSGRFARLARKLTRPVCLVGSVLLLLGALFLLFFFLLPELGKTGRQLVSNLPAYALKIEGWWLDLRALVEGFGIVIPPIDLQPERLMGILSDFFQKYGNNVMNTAVSITSSLVTAIVNLVIGIAFSLYVLAQKEKLGRAARRFLEAFWKEARVKRILEVASLTNQTFTNFITGQLAEAVIIGVLCFIGMLIFRMPYAAIVSVLVGVTALVPVFGAIIGAVVGAFLILLVNPMKALWFLVFLIVLQQLEGNLIYPKVVGKSVGLPGILVLVAVSVGSSLGGMVGMMLGVPVTAVGFVLLRQAVDRRLAAKAAAKAEAAETDGVADVSENAGAASDATEAATPAAPVQPAEPGKPAEEKDRKNG